MLAKLLCTKRKSASAPRCLRCLGATIDIVNSITRTANRSGQGGIFASMFTKGQHRGHGDHWAWRLTGNYWSSKRWSGPLWRAAHAPTDPAKPDLSRHAPRGFPQRHRWTGHGVPAGAGGEPDGGCRLRLPQPDGDGAQAAALRRPGLLAVSEALIAGALYVVADDPGHTGAAVSTGGADSALEWRSRTCADGARLAPGGLRRGPTAGIGPGQPRRRVSPDLRPVFLQRDQVLHRIDTRIEAGGDQAGEDARNVRTVLTFVKQRVVALPNEQLQRPLRQIVVQRRSGHR